MKPELSRVNEPGEPFFVVIASDQSALTQLFLQCHSAWPTTMVRLVRGVKCETGRGFFDQIAPALQFMPYFGDNWNAFDECLVSLWQASDSLVLFVTDGENFLTGSDADFASFVKIIAGANLAYEDNATGTTHDARPVKVVFGVGGDAQDFVDRLAVHAESRAITTLSPTIE